MGVMVGGGEEKDRDAVTAPATGLLGMISDGLHTIFLFVGPGSLARFSSTCVQGWRVSRGPASPSRFLIHNWRAIERVRQRVTLKELFTSKSLYTGRAIATQPNWLQVSEALESALGELSQLPIEMDPALLAEALCARAGQCEVRPSPIHGEGLFASQDLPAHHVLCTYHAVYTSRSRATLDEAEDCIVVKYSTVESGGSLAQNRTVHSTVVLRPPQRDEPTFRANFGRFANHSEAPNVDIVTDRTGTTRSFLSNSPPLQRQESRLRFSHDPKRAFVFVVTNEAVRKGSELLLNYGPHYFDGPPDSGGGGGGGGVGGGGGGDDGGNDGGGSGGEGKL